MSFDTHNHLSAFSRSGNLKLLVPEIELHRRTFTGYLKTARCKEVHTAHSFEIIWYSVQVLHAKYALAAPAGTSHLLSKNIVHNAL